MSSTEYTPYTVDVVFCIDVTASMTPYLDELKKLARDFDQVLQIELKSKIKISKNFAAELFGFVTWANLLKMPLVRLHFLLCPRSNIFLLQNLIL